MSNTDKVVEFLKGSIKEAQDNKACAAVVIMIGGEGQIIDGWTGGDYDKFALIGAIESVKHDFIDVETDRRRNIPE